MPSDPGMIINFSCIVLNSNQSKINQSTTLKKKATPMNLLKEPKMEVF